MATITKPMALDESFNTTEVNSRNQADVLVGIENAIREGFGQVASGIEYDNTESSITATNVQDAIDEVDGIVDGIESDIQGTQSVSGNPLTVTDAAPIYAEEVDVAVECTQTGSGIPSPSNIRPIQGYDIVSVDRCGKNLFDGALKQGASSEYVINTNKLKVKPNTTYYWVEFNWSNSGSKQAFYYDLSNILISYENVSGNSFTTPANCVRVTIQHYKSGGLSIPTNPQIVISTTLPTQYEPYNGQTVSLQLGNKNLLPMTVEGIKAANSTLTWNGNSATRNGITYTIYTNKDGCVAYIDANGTANAESTLALGNCPSDGKPYKLNGSAGGSNNTYSVRVGGYGGSGDGDFSFTPTSANNVYIQVISGQTISHKKFYPMIRDASVVDPTFSPYNPTLGGMVYGGQLTLKDDGSAVFVGDRVYREFTANDSNTWNLLSGYSNTFYCAWTKDSIAPTATGTDGVCSSYNVVRKATSSLANGEITLNNTGISLSYSSACVKDTQYSTAANFKASLTTPLQIVYPLATPFTIHLSAEQLKLLQGTNNVWSNAGNVTLKYQPDNVIAEPKADVQRLRDDLDDRLVGNACKNLINKENVINGYINSSVSSGYNGEILASSSGSKTVYCLLEAGTYTVQKMASTRFRYALYDDKPTIGSRSRGDGYNDVNGTTTTFTLVAQRWVAFFIVNGSDATDVANTNAILGSIQVERGSSPTPYEEYYPSNRELANLVDSSLVKCNPTTDYADRSHYIDISAYDDNKPIFGYVYLAKGAYIRYCPVWLMKDWGTDEPSNTIITAHVTSYFKFTFYYNNSPRRVMLAEVKDYNDDDVSGYNAIRLYLYRNY